jgi:hypothetical protein
MTIEHSPSKKNSPIVERISNEVPSNRETTVLNRMIATASLTIPSPKIKLNNLGYSSYLIIDMAAMTSDEQSNEPVRNDSYNVKLNCSGLN